ncbi:CRISPR-associated endonuclease Cas1 [Henriciella marina]|uniref:CRISPR-associated endonuclease Cas1 n=1 Tax=Henriciella marina TaxID=453851 RepID=UPI00035D1308|nr:CRISPR-associated endonuclease Cas1 [Henriciella marina]
MRHETFENLVPEDQDEWSARSNYWLARSETCQSPRKRRERQKRPLILVGYGLSIKVEKGRLIIQDGTTHFPSKPVQHVFFKGSLDLPPRIVIIDGAGSITLDAVDWLTEQGIALIRIKYDGSNTSVMSPTGYAGDPEKIAWQMKARESEALKIEFAAPLTIKKLEAALVTLRDCLPASADRSRAIEATSACLEFIESGRADKTQKLRGQEGKAAYWYWRAWHPLDINWKAAKQFPIPEEWRTFTARSSVNSSKKEPNRNASHPINAMLNYVYTALLTQTKIKAIADGYDPMIGVMHNQREKNKDNTPSFALDLMEPMRPVVDRVILKLIAEETFSGADFDLQSDGVVRVNPVLVKTLVRVLNV